MNNKIIPCEKLIAIYTNEIEVFFGLNLSLHETDDFETI